MERLHTIQSFVNVLRVSHVVDPFTEKIWPLHRFNLNRLYIACYVGILDCVLLKVMTFNNIKNFQYSVG